MITRRTIAGALVLVLIAAACGDDGVTGGTTTGPDPATDPGAEPAVMASLDISYSNPDAGIATEYSIECGETEAVTGEVDGVTAARACGALGDAAVVERLVEGPDDELCTEIYGGADVAEIEGTIDGRAVDTTVDRTNGCGIDDWDRLLGGLLPPPVGVAPDG